MYIKYKHPNNDLVINTSRQSLFAYIFERRLLHAHEYIMCNTCFINAV